MLTIQVALTSEAPGSDLSQAKLARIAAALQKQVTRDFAPIWKVRATVDAFATLQDVPLGYWPMIVVPDVQGAAGVHLDQDGQPYALIELSESISLTASHECLEMLADPFGNRVIAGPSIKPRQGRVSYLVEVCDPSEASEFGYTVNSYLVSDFYTPRYFDPVAATGMRYSFTGAIKRPRQVLRGGYLSWEDPVTKHWWQQTYFAAKPKFVDLGKLNGARGSLRSQIDALTPHPDLDGGLPAGNAALKAARSSGKSDKKARGARAESLREQIAALMPA